MKKAVKVIKKIVDVFCWILVAVIALTMILAVGARMKGDSPSLFGYSVYRVSSASMEPQLMVGDVILGKAVTDPKTIEVGDIVTYEGKDDLAGMLITHEVIIPPTEEDGRLMLQTKGIANDDPDAPIEADTVVSVMVCEVSFLIPFYNFFFSPWGLLTIVGLIIVVFIDELILLVKTLMGYSEEQESINDIIDRLQAEKRAEGSESEKKTDKDSSSDN